MSDQATAAEKLQEAQALAFTPELLAFCEAQRAFIESGEDEDFARLRAHSLAKEARRRRILPEGVLLAMQCGGCYRGQSEGMGSAVYSRRYSIVLSYLLTSYFGPESRSSAWLVVDREQWSTSPTQSASSRKESR